MAGAAADSSRRAAHARAEAPALCANDVGVVGSIFVCVSVGRRNLCAKVDSARERVVASVKKIVEWIEPTAVAGCAPRQTSEEIGW